jgi:hypothetical protein
LTFSGNSVARSFSSAGSRLRSPDKCERVRCW